VKSPIPTFDLYGETHSGAEAGPLHVETLHVRAEVNAWNILAHRHTGLSQIFVFFTGGGTVEIDGTSHALRPPALVWLPAGTVHGFAFEPDTDGIVITAAGETVRLAAERDPDSHALLLHPLLVNGLEDGPAERLGAFARDLATEVRDALPGTRAAAQHLFGLMLIALARAVETGSALPERAAATTYRAFRDLVDKHFRDRWTVPLYARRLGLTPDRLHDICQSNGGRPPMQIVHDRLMIEARRALLYTGMSVTEIGFGLGFEDPAYFTRFFARRAGIPPTAFRARGR